MSNEYISTKVHDLLNPLTGTRQSVKWAGDALQPASSDVAESGAREIDGSKLWLLPALYDADAHMPHVQFGVRRSDQFRALCGGVAQMNVALPWQLARAFDLRTLVADTARAGLPKFIPLLSVSPNVESAEFPAWLRAHISEVTDLLPGVCKLYSLDPYFNRNLDAVWDAGLKAMVWCATDEALSSLVEHERGPLHLRHAVSGDMVTVMRQAAGATLQTSPHFLLTLSPGKRERLEVLPTPPSENDRLSLAERVLDAIDVIASDHVAPYIHGAPISPGLQTQQHFLQALITLSERFGWPLEVLIAKATKGPANVFDVTAPDGFLLVDPEHVEKVSLWPNQTLERAPFEDLTMRGRVLAATRGGMIELV